MKQNLLKSWDVQPFSRNKRLMDAFKKVPRELFTSHDYKTEAYEDIPLPIPGDQTISQPTTVMIMIHELELKSSDIVLEIGAGSGYNAALMAQLCEKVYSLEVVSELVTFAKNNLKKAKITNVEVIKADGSQGYPKAAPYNKIICTAACPKIPQPWIDQLKDHGIIIAPVGDRFSQEMIKAIKVGNELITRKLGGFTFVPLKGKHGFEP